MGGAIRHAVERDPREASSVRYKPGQSGGSSSFPQKPPAERRLHQKPRLDKPLRHEIYVSQKRSATLAPNYAPQNRAAPAGPLVWRRMELRGRRYQALFEAGCAASGGAVETTKSGFGASAPAHDHWKNLDKHFGITADASAAAATRWLTAYFCGCQCRAIKDRAVSRARRRRLRRTSRQR